MNTPDDTPLKRYELVEWNKPHNRYKRKKIILMTEHEALELNTGLAFNRQDMRYVMIS